MTTYEIAIISLRRFMIALYFLTHQQLRKIVSTLPDKNIQILDVGARSSPYTVGLPGQVTATDLPRESAVQLQLQLGFTDAIVNKLQKRRSNIKEVVFDDMTKSKLPDNTYDLVTAVEVLEHVEEDELFVQHVARVLKPGGYFVMTTPNGDAVENTNPDHKRHYLHDDLEALLKRHFAEVTVEYRVRRGKSHFKSLKSLSLRRPLKTLSSMCHSWININQSLKPLAPHDAHHHIAVARKKS